MGVNGYLDEGYMKKLTSYILIFSYLIFNFLYCISCTKYFLYLYICRQRFLSVCVSVHVVLGFFACLFMLYPQVLEQFLVKKILIACVNK